MKTGITKRLTSFALTAALMLSLAPAVLPTEAKAGFLEEYAIEKLVAMSETGLSKIIAGVDSSCGDDKVSSFVNTWLFEDAGTAATVERIEELCEEILDRLDELEDEIREETSKIEQMIAQATTRDALDKLDGAWKDQVEDQIPNDIAAAVEAYQEYFRAARQYGITPTKANRDAKDAARAELREAFVEVYQAENGSYSASDLDAAMKTTLADKRFQDCMAALTRQLNPDNYNSVSDYAAMAAYQYLLYSDDQYSFVNSYQQKQLLTIGWVLLAYNELMAMQGEYIEETCSGTEYDQRMADYGYAKGRLADAGASLLEEAADLMDRALTFSPLEPVKLRLAQLMKPEDNVIVSLRNGAYHTSFPMTKVMEEPGVAENARNYMEENSQYVKDPDNPAVMSPQTADFELVGVTAGTGTAFYYILQQIFPLQALEYKFNFKSGALYSPDVHSPSCDWYNLRDWGFAFDSSNAAEDVKAMFGQATALALYGNTVRSALGEEHSPYTGDQTMYLFTPDYVLNYELGTSYARISFLEAEEEVSGDSVPSVDLSAEKMQADGGSKRNDVAVYIVKRTDSSRTVNAVTQGDCVLELDVEQEKGRTPNYRDSVSQPFGRYLSIRCRANGDEKLSHLYVKRYLNADKSKYTLEVIADSDILSLLTPDADGFYSLTFPMPACEADILLTTASEDTGGVVTAAGFQQQKERLTALQKDTAVRTADVVAGSVSGKTVAPLTELLQRDEAGTRAALRQITEETGDVSGRKQTCDNALKDQTNSRVSEAYKKLDGAWRYRVTDYTGPFSGAMDRFRTYVTCLADGSDASAAEAAYEQALNALSDSGDFRSDSALAVSVEKALARLIYGYTLTDETRLEPFGSTDPYDEYLETRVASLPLQAARAAYEMVPFVNDQYDMISTYLDAQTNEIAWLLLMYQDMVSRQDPEFAGYEGYPSHVSRLAQLFLAGLETAVDSEMTFWADKDSNRVVTMRLSAYPTGADVYDGSTLLKYRFRDAGYMSSMGVSQWRTMENKGYEMHFSENGSANCPAEIIDSCNAFYFLPVLAGHSAAGANAGEDLQFFHLLAGTHPLYTLEYKNNVSMGSDYHVPSTDYFNLMAEGYGEEGSVTETSLAKLTGAQAFVNSGTALKDLLKPFVSSGQTLYLLVEPSANSDPKVKWDTNGTKYVKLPMADTGEKTLAYEYISAEDFQSGSGKQHDEYAFLRKAEHGSLTVTGTVTNPGRGGEAVMGVAADSVGYDPLNNAIWKESLTAEPGSSVHLRIKPGDGETVTSLAVRRYTQEDAPGTVTSAEVIADRDDFRYLEKDENGWYHLEVTVPYSWVGVSFSAETSYAGGSQNGRSDGGAAAAVNVSKTFTDVSGAAWYHDAVQWAVDKGLMNGTSDTTFEPNGTATRAMAVTMLWRLAGEPASDSGASFADVKVGAWYADAVAWAAESGVVNGTSDTTFAPGAPVTREELAAILYRCAQAQGKGFTGAWYFPLDFPDADQVSDYANEAMHWMTMHGVLTGMGGGTLAPRDNATRAQIAAMFLRFCEAIAQ